MDLLSLAPDLLLAAGAATVTALGLRVPAVRAKTPCQWYVASTEQTAGHTVQVKRCRTHPAERPRREEVD